MDLPDIDELVALEAVLHMRSAFTTLDVADWLRQHRPEKSLSRRSNAEIGKFLSNRANILQIQSDGPGGARGHRWRRSLPGNVVAFLLWLYERGYHMVLIRFLQRFRPRLAQEYERIAERLRRKPAFKDRGQDAVTPAADDSAWLAWHDKRLAVKTDTALRRRYRLLQSWYRETQLRVPPGRNGQGRLVGSMIDLDASIADPDLNFLDDDIAVYVDVRLPEIQATGGTVDPDRLRRNLLSSQPLCFNLFGGLRTQPDAAAAVLSDVFDLDIDVIEELTVEYAPLPAGKYLGDRTAFDAFLVYRTFTGERGFVGVETKYTEPFSPKVYTVEQNSRYADWTTPEFGFREGAASKLEHKNVNQLWRNALLAVAVRAVDGFDRGHVAVLGCENDRGIAKAVATLSAQLAAPKGLVRSASFEHLIARAVQEDALAAWADAFRRRYLDLAAMAAP